jgi:hypothetical protein
MAPPPGRETFRPIVLSIELLAQLPIAVWSVNGALTIERHLCGNALVEREKTSAQSSPASARVRRISAFCCFGSSLRNERVTSNSIREVLGSTSGWSGAPSS